MASHRIPYEETFAFCVKVFQGHGFSEEESRQIADVLLDADLSGIESHGIQRLINYHKKITNGLVDLNAKPEIIRETPLSATIEGHHAMGQPLSTWAMSLAIEKARQHGVGMVTVRNSNHFGIAGYYAKMAARAGFLGVSMTNTEAILVPTYGRRAILGTNPIAVSMPAAPIPFTFDAATTVVPRGKLEVYAKRDGVIPDGWALDENGNPSSDAARVLANIINKTGGGILPLGGAGMATSGHKGYGLSMLVEICTGILSGGLTSNYVCRTPDITGDCHFFMAVDYGMFGDKQEIEAHLSALLQELRDSDKAEGQDRIYTHGEKEFEARQRIMAEGIPISEKAYDELRMIARYAGVENLLPEIIN